MHFVLEKQKSRILRDWEAMVADLRAPETTVDIAIVGKYTQLHDAYLSVVEALKHGGISCRAKTELIWIDSEELNEKNMDQLLHSSGRDPCSRRLRETGEPRV